MAKYLVYTQLFIYLSLKNPFVTICFLKFKFVILNLNSIYKSLWIYKYKTAN